MCTRFYIEKENPELADIIAAASRSILSERFMRQMAKPVLTSGEIRPTDVVPVIAPNRNGMRAVFPMKWGFTLPKSRQPLVNARVETASEKQTFKECWQKRRCVIPASWYFEREHLMSVEGKVKTGDKFLIQPNDASVTWLCGLYRFEDELPVFTVLTRTPSKELARIHDRMPFILPKDKIDGWITPNSMAEELLQYALTSVIAERQTSHDS